MKIKMEWCDVGKMPTLQLQTCWLEAGGTAVPPNKLAHIILNSTMKPKFFADFADIKAHGVVAVSFEGYLKANNYFKETVMKIQQNVTLLALITLILIGLAGCEPKSSVKVDQKKSLETIKAEASKMSVTELRKKAMLFKNAITAQSGQVTNIMETMNPDANGNTNKNIELNNSPDIDKFMQTIGDLKKRYDIYISYLKQKNGDLTGLSLSK